MLPTPDTSHIPTSLVYDPVEDSYLLLDTFSSDTERTFLKSHFFPSSPISTSTIPLVLELGSGSGVVSAFLAANSRHIFGGEVLCACTDLNPHACRATRETIAKELMRKRQGGPNVEGPGEDAKADTGLFLGVSNADLEGPWSRGIVDVLVFNPPYVPTPALPSKPEKLRDPVEGRGPSETSPPSFEEEEYFLGLAYAGGYEGMEVTNRVLEKLGDILSPRGCAYIVLCAQNHPEQVKERIRAMGADWKAETVGSSGKKAGWEKLQIMRAWRENTMHS
ncbi:hypothetical protein jhhlp_002231 [Lomentospora prolificans]|uniref:Methyltransferase small domain-containing protein n=1 Tax=Lomentospora prolificans TaxID=41688 RepID=A0A2N3NDF4_9PEZI|nr:hypothetical protein jhhlp_002231 [Lomentospora prolificans]